MEISKAFRHREVFCSPISEMNDPLDCNPVLENSSFREVTDTIRKYRIPVVSNESLRRFGADKRMTRKIKKHQLLKMQEYLGRQSNFIWPDLDRGPWLLASVKTGTPL
jgi:hypothetical protein